MTTGPGEARLAPTLEALLTTLTAGDWWVSNVFQTWGGAGNPFGETPGWKAHLRNRSTTQTGSGEGPSLLAALSVALDAATALPAYRSGYRDAGGEARRAPTPPGATVILAIPDSGEEDLF